MVGTIIDDLFDERGWKVFLGTSVVDITKVCADANSALFFFNGDRVGDPRNVSNGVNEPDNA
jgi:hypothetical protein